MLFSNSFQKKNFACPTSAKRWLLSALGWLRGTVECEVLQKARYINTLTFTFLPLPTLGLYGKRVVNLLPKGLSYRFVWSSFIQSRRQKLPS